MRSANSVPPTDEDWTVRAVKLLDIPALYADREPAPERSGMAIYLPEIQRSSVWDARRVLDLWDSMLRGFPIGAFYVVPRKQALAYDLLDGQQRLRALLVGLKCRTDDKRCLWVDLDIGQGSERPRLFLTSQAQPFGYQADGRKLSPDDRRRARRAYARAERDEDSAREDDGLRIAGKPSRLAYDLDLFSNKITDRHGCDLPSPPPPYRRGARPVRLQPLLSAWLSACNEAEKRRLAGDEAKEHRLAALASAVQRERVTREEERPSDDALAREGGVLRTLDHAFGRLRASEVALINCRFLDDADQLQLFRRIGENGVALSQEERLYSIFKSNIPSARQAVEAIDVKVGKILPPTKIVAAALRIANKQAYKSLNLPSPEALAEILSDTRGGSSKKVELEHCKFRNELERLIPKSGDGTTAPLCRAFMASKSLLERNGDAGPFWLPDAAIAQLPEQLWLVLVYWASRPSTPEASDENRREVVRFVLFWQLAVVDEDRAMSRASDCLDTLYEARQAHFPGRAIYAHLVARSDDPKTVAYEITRPKRFDPERAPEWRSDTVRFGKDGSEWPIGLAWWTRAKRMLLWLQRDYVSNAFQGYRPLSDHEDDVPWDFDHLCPQASWYWDGRGGTDHYDDIDGIRTEVGHDYIWALRDRASQFANRIGNLRIVNASTNRFAGKRPLTEKLPILFSQADQASAEARAEARKWLMPVMEAELADWKTAAQSEKDGRWSAERRKAFQAAVERRAFRLYEEFFDGLEYCHWVDADDRGPSATIP